MKALTGIRLALTLLLAAIVFPLPILIAWPISEQRRRKVMFYPWLVFARGLRRIFLANVTVEGREFAGGPFEHGHLFICNHLSLADTPLLVSVFPLPFIAKRETLKVPIIGQAGYMAGNIVFDRSDQDARRRVIGEAIRRIKEVNSIYLFPEGTRSKTGIPKAEPYWAMICAAWDEGIDVVPMAIHGSRDVLRRPTARVRIKLSAPIKCADHPDRDQFARACWNRVLEMFYELKAVAETGVPREITDVTPSPTLPAVFGDVLEQVVPDVQEKRSPSE